MLTQVKPAALRLINGAEQIVIRPLIASGADPILCQRWDLGAPEVRYTTVPRPGGDGVDAGPGFLGQRTVTLDLQIQGGLDPVTGTEHDAYWYAERLTAMAHPQATPLLAVTRPEQGTYLMALRGQPWNLPYSQRAAALLELQLSFLCPTGMLEADPPRTYSTTDYTGPDPTGAWKFPAGFPYFFGEKQDAYPVMAINVGGQAAISPTVYISGPVTDPYLRTDDGDKLRFAGLSLTAAQTVEISMETGTVRLGEADDQSAYGAIDWAVSSYWRWQPGLHVVRYLNTTGRATIQFRERRLTL